MPAAYLVQRSRQFHLRLRIPADLAHLFGRRELHCSLRVADPRLARSLAGTLRAQAEAAFATIRHRQALGDNQPSLLQLARSIYAERIPSTRHRAMRAYPISTRVNSVRNDNVAILEEVG